MKQLFFLIVAFPLMLLTIGWTNALRPEGTAIRLDLKDFSGIVTSSQPDEREKFAAAQLSVLLSKTTGAKLPVLQGVPSADKPKILFEPADKALGLCGYRIELKGRDLCLAGGTQRGVINAVLALLEEDLGVRWYAVNENPRVVPSGSSVISVVPRTYVPQLLGREPFFADAFNPYWEIFNRTNQTWYTYVPEKFGGAWNFPRSLFCHTFDKLLPASLFKEHPEYFAMIDGKRKVQKNGHYAAHLCMTNPDVPHIVAQNAIALLKKQKTPYEIISISQNDGGKGFCQCPSCAEFAKREGSVSGPLVDFVNKVAQEIHQTYPDITVETLAYLESIQPPKTVRPGPNVVIRICTDSHAWPFPYFYLEESKTCYDALVKWNAIGAKMLIWDYVTSFSDYPMPNPNIWVMDHNLDIFLKNGAIGVMQQGSYQSPCGAEAYLKAWVFAKRMWNPKWKLEPLMNDFIDGYYGPAAPAMHKYYAYEKKAWLAFHEKHAGKPLSKPGPRFAWTHEDSEAMKKILDEAFALAGKDATLNKRLKRDYFNWLYMRLSLGPKSEDDIKDFRKDIQDFRDSAATFKITRFSESGGNSQIEEKIAAFECGIADTLYRQAPAGAFRFCSHNVSRLWPAGKQTAVRMSEDGRGILAQEGGANAWSIQWRLDAKNYAPGLRGTTFAPGQKYKLVMKCKADYDGEGPAETLFSANIYDKDNQTKYYGRVNFKSDSAPAGQWVTLKSDKSFIPTEGGVLYVSPSKSTRLKKLYVDHILMEPVNE